MKVTGEHVRMLRGAFRMSMHEFARFVKVVPSTVVSLEAGRGTKPKTPAKILAAFEAYVEFVEPDESGRGPGIILKKGFEAIVRNDTQGAATSQGDDTGALDALGWDWESESVEDDEPLPPLDWTDEDRADQIEHWRSRPEAWAKLHEVSRQCLLRAMGVEAIEASHEGPTTWTR
jgi:DNA-binding XRE family transcriptional regulator